MVAEAEVTAVVTAEDATRYGRFRESALLNKDPSVRWCPSATCGKPMRGWVRDPPLPPLRERALDGASAIAVVAAAFIVGFVVSLMVQVLVGGGREDAAQKWSSTALGLALAAGVASVVLTERSDREKLTPWGKRSTCLHCGTSVCFDCKQPWHPGTSCEQVEAAAMAEWTEKHDSGRCPKCRTVIERSEGCNHMSCRCGYEFCWLCGEKCKFLCE